MADAMRKPLLRQEELKAKGLVRGYYGKAGRGVLRATFTDALIGAGKAYGE